MSEAPVSVEPADKSLSAQIWDALENSADRKQINEARRLRQKKILENLPPDFDMEIKAFAAYAENMSKNPLEPQIAGEMFENLVRVDEVICPIQETEEAKVIRSILKDPEMYALQNEGIDKSVRNPDVARINEEGKLVGAVEVKAGKIGFRGSQQLGLFKENLTNLVSKLEKIDPQALRSHGLGVIADNLDKLQVSDDFAVTLAVPFGAYNGDSETLIKKEDFWKAGELETAKVRVDNCKIIESAFSRKELREIANYTLSWLGKKW